MAQYDSGVKAYVRAVAEVEVFFPIDFRDRREVACKHCPYLSSNERMCQLNKQPVAYPMQFIGQNCPLIFDEERIFEDESN